MRAKGYEWETTGSVLTTVGHLAQLSTAHSFTFCPELTSSSAHLSNGGINRSKTGGTGGLNARQQLRNRQHHRHPHRHHRNNVVPPNDQHPVRHRPSGAATSPSAPQLRVGLAELPLAPPSLSTWRVDKHHFQVHSSRPVRQQHTQLFVEGDTILTSNAASETSLGSTCDCQSPNPQFCTLHLLRSAAFIQPRRVKTWLPLSICSVYNSTTLSMSGGGATDSDSLCQLTEGHVIGINKRTTTTPPTGRYTNHKMLSAWYGTQYAVKQKNIRELHRTQFLQRQSGVGLVSSKAYNENGLRPNQLSTFSISLLVDRNSLDKYRYQLSSTRTAPTSQDTAAGLPMVGSKSSPCFQLQSIDQSDDVVDSDAPLNGFITSSLSALNRSKTSTNIVEHHPKDSWQTRRAKAIRRTSSEPCTSNIPVASSQVDNMPRLPQPVANDVTTKDQSAVSSTESVLERQMTAAQHRHRSAAEMSVDGGSDVMHHGEQFRDEPGDGEKHTNEDVERENSPQTDDGTADDYAIAESDTSCGGNNTRQCTMPYVAGAPRKYTFRQTTCLSTVGSARDATSTGGMSNYRLRNRIGYRQSSNLTYSDPMLDAPVDFIQRLEEISILELETIRCERNPVRRLKKKLPTPLSMPVGSSVPW